jgi:hypothetical protein
MTVKASSIFKTSRECATYAVTEMSEFTMRDPFAGLPDRVEIFPSVFVSKELLMRCEISTKPVDPTFGGHLADEFTVTWKVRRADKANPAWVENPQQVEKLFASLVE